MAPLEAMAATILLGQREAAGGCRATAALHGATFSSCKTEAEAAEAARVATEEMRALRISRQVVSFSAAAVAEPLDRASIPPRERPVDSRAAAMQANPKKTAATRLAKAAAAAAAGSREGLHQ